MRHYDAGMTDFSGIHMYMCRHTQLFKYVHVDFTVCVCAHLPLSSAKHVYVTALDE